MFIEQAIQTLKQSGHKITKPRMQVLEFFAHHDQPSSPYDIQKIDPTLDIVSIYRTVELLEKLHLIHKIWSLGGYVACRLQQTQCSHDCCHEFQVCNQCHSYQEIHGHHHHPDQSKGFQTTQHISEQLGLCSQCIN